EVPDRQEAARWYQTVLGFQICPEFESWGESRSGPLMISSDEGNTKLALFEGQPQGAKRPIGIRRIAFRIGGSDVLTLVKELDSPEKGDPIEHSEIIDHDKSFSTYFSDPYGTPLEVTTYDYDFVAPRIGNSK